jgi:hypothetical protein
VSGYQYVNAHLAPGGTLREWILNVTRRSAEEAVAHLFCEILWKRSGSEWTMYLNSHFRRLS